jgi:pilus assembly protein Flp/PilA
VIFLKKVLSVLKSEKGQGMVEYGLIIALVSIAVIVAITALGGNLNNIFNTINNTLRDIQP